MYIYLYTYMSLEMMSHIPIGMCDIDHVVPTGMYDIATYWSDEAACTFAA